MKIKLLLIALAFVGTMQGQSIFDKYNLKTTSSGLKYAILNAGEGEFPNDGDRLWVHYYGKLPNDSIFDTSENRGPLDFMLGQGKVIKGWDEGVRLIKPGGSILLVVPPNLAYGEQGYGAIPGNTTLVFEINLVQVDRDKAQKPYNVAGLEKQQTPEGLSYYVVKEGTGEKAKPGDNAYLHFIAMLPSGKIMDSSFDKTEPIRVSVGAKHVFEGWDLGIQLMNTGSRYRVIIPSELAYGKKGFKNIVPPNTDITMDMLMVKITPEIKVERWDASGKDTITTASGLKYIVFETGSGDLVKANDIVEVHYTGYFPSGRMFDSSVKREEPIKFPIGANAVIDGWDEGLRFMRKGAKLKLLVPSELGYGKRGAPPQIPPSTNLEFDIELLDIIK